jgi:hypothetical protein
VSICKEKEMAVQCVEQTPHPSLGINVAEPFERVMSSRTNQMARAFQVR